MEPHRPPRPRRKLHMPRIRTPHEGRHRLAAQTVAAGIKRSPVAGGRLPSPTAGLRRSPVAGGPIPVAHGGHQALARRRQPRPVAHALEPPRPLGPRGPAGPAPVHAPSLAPLRLPALPAAARRLLGQQPRRLARGDRALAAHPARDRERAGGHRAVGARALRPRAARAAGRRHARAHPARRGCCPACTSPRRRCSERSPSPPPAERPSR